VNGEKKKQFIVDGCITALRALIVQGSMFKVKKPVHG